MRIAIASDHAGFRYKEAISGHLRSRGQEPVDFGTDSDEAVDYPDFVRPAAEAVGRGQCERGVVLGGSGNGEAMVANRVRGVRCALCWNRESAELARRHNDANMISLGERMMSLETALEIVDVWLETPFDGGRHERRIRKIDEPAEGHVAPARVPGRLRIRYSRHAEDEMAKRRFSEDDIRVVLADPREVIEDPTTFTYLGVAGGRGLGVVVARDLRDPIWVVTVFPTRRRGGWR
jgi:ribose 5-phosphate isomerase B